ncbi:MAG: RraA family protein [Nitrospinae bacterium]|nr:RraA family protein [Nitrospinota bacterium]
MSNDLVNRLRGYSACQVADAFDKLKIRGHMPDIILLSPDPDYRMVGEAHTVRMVPAGGGPLPKREVHHIDAAPEGSIVVISIPPGVTTANWGGMMTTRAKVMNLGGVVLDGRARDIEEHRQAGFPVFARGVSVHGSGGYTVPISVGEPINCGGVAVRQGDIILGDVNGVVVIPGERLEEVIDKMDELAEIEEKIIAELDKGMSIGEAFSRHRN